MINLNTPISVLSSKYGFASPNVVPLSPVTCFIPVHHNGFDDCLIHGNVDVNRHRMFTGAQMVATVIKMTILFMLLAICVACAAYSKWDRMQTNNKTSDVANSPDPKSPSAVSIESSLKFGKICADQTPPLNRTSNSCVHAFLLVILTFIFCGQASQELLDATYEHHEVSKFANTRK